MNQEINSINQNNNKGYLIVLGVQDQEPMNEEKRVSG